jgi:hypothetical protein
MAEILPNRRKTPINQSINQYNKLDKNQGQGHKVKMSGPTERSCHKK